jgi:hypothetical protein
MKQEEREFLIEQVLKVIQREKGNEDYNYYGDFFSECNKFHLTEKDFRQTVLRLAFERFGAVVEQDPELHIPNLSKFVDLFGHRCYNLFQLGRVLFEHPSKSEEYLEDVVFIKHDVTFLTSNSSLGLDISRLFKAEEDPYNRYLRIAYRLNRKLPFRIGNELFQSLPELLEKAALDFGLHSNLANEFKRGRLQIWIEESQKHLSGLPEGNDDHDFLSFVYRLDKNYPFYLGETPVFTPNELVEICKKEVKSWPHLFQFIENGQITIWLNAIGKKDWAEDLSKDQNMVDQLDYLQGTDKEMTRVQLLLQKIEPEFIPVLKPKTQVVSLNSISRKDIFEQRVTVILSTKGYVIANVSVDREVEGVVGPNPKLYFHDLSGHLEDQIRFTVDPSQLTRNKVYQFTVFVETVFETLEIKVELKVVFPIVNFFIENLKYVLLFAFLFGVSRALVGIEFPDWLSFYGSYFLEWQDMAFIPFNYYYFGGIFFILIIALLFTTIWIIKKYQRYGGE